MSFQGFMNGGQARDIFAAYNAKAGSAIVDMSRNYNTGDTYSTRIGTGNQIDLAFAEINANEATVVFNTLVPDYSNGPALKAKFAKLTALINVSGPIWREMDDEVINQTTGTWSVTDLDTQCISVGITTYAVTTGTLPTGISLNEGTGVISGNPTNSGAGTVAFTATDDNGAVESSFVQWSVV